MVDDGSHDATGERARRRAPPLWPAFSQRGKGPGASPRRRGSGCEGRGRRRPAAADADLGPSAARLVPLVEAVREQGKDLAIASFSSRGGFGLAEKASQRRAFDRLTGRLFEAPSRAEGLVPQGAGSCRRFPAGWGVEVAMTVKALDEGLTSSKFRSRSATGRPGRISRASSTGAGSVGRFSSP